MRESGTARKHLETRTSLEGLVLCYFMRVKITKESPKERQLRPMQALSLCCPVFLSRQLISPSPTFWWAWERKRDVSETFVVWNYKNPFDRNGGVALIKSEIPSSEAAGISHVGWEIIAALVLIREKQNKSCFKASVVLALSI